MTTVYTNKPAPSLIVPTLDGKEFDLTKQNPDNFTIVAFYRGRHCPICINQLKEIQESFGDAKDKGMDVIAISMDTEEKARDAVAKVVSSFGTASEERKKETFDLPIGYNLTEAQARSWGLYMSQGRAGEPQVFSEPGMFVIRPDSTVFFAQVQSAPFTRPNFASLLGGLQYAVANDYPARGTITKEFTA